MRKAALFFFALIIVLFMTGCGSQSQPPVVGLPLGTGQFVSVTITDSPPSGVTVLCFQLSITGAALTQQSGGSSSLLSSTNPIPVNLSQLQTDSALLANATVHATEDGEGFTYTAMTLTFANPELTIYNGSGATIGSGANACANDTICQLTPTATPLTLTFSSAPFPITLPTTNALAFAIDVHLNTVIQPDLSLNLAAPNGVTVSELPAPPSGTTIPAIGNLMGTIQSVPAAGATPASDYITLQTGDGRTFTISLDSNTTYTYPSAVCSAENATCLAVGQIVNVALSLQNTTSAAIQMGGLLASRITYVQAAGQTVVQGNIVQLRSSGGNTIMDLILQQGPPTPSASNLPIGNRATVTVPSAGVTYAIDSDNFTLPGGLTFATAANLMVGQQVSVVAAAGSVTTPNNPPSTTPISGPAAITFTASSITLEPGQITGVVNSAFPINMVALSFVIGTYPNYFVPPVAAAGAPPTPLAINLTVQTTSATTFTNLNPDSMAGLSAGDVVSVKGWLFPYGALPQFCIGSSGCAPIGELAAETVLGRPGPTPLF
jgi:hypothetical protein